MKNRFKTFFEGVVAALPWNLWARRRTNREERVFMVRMCAPVYSRGPRPSPQNGNTGRARLFGAAANTSTRSGARSVGALTARVMILPGANGNQPVARRITAVGFETGEAVAIRVSQVRSANASQK